MIKNAHSELHQQINTKMNIEEKKAEEYTIGNITSSSEKNKKYIKKVLEANGKIPELCKKEQIIYMEKKLDESLGEIAQLSDTLTIEQYELEQIEKERVSVKKGDR